MRKLNLDILRKARLFEQLSEPEINSVFSCLKPQTQVIQKDDLLVHDGQTLNDFFILESGKLAAYKLYADGHTTLLQNYIPSFTIGLDITASKTRLCTY